MNRDAWAIFVGLITAAVVGLLGVTAWQKHQQALRVTDELDRTRQAAASQTARLQEAWQEVEAAREQAGVLAREFARATNTQQRLEAEMREALQSRDVAISELQGRLTVNILDRILFDSGEAALKPEGMQVLEEVAKILARYTNRTVQVFGHTDNVPIRVKFASNWELSAARALAAVRYLTEKAGVDPRRLSAVSCAEFQPIADNATPEGRARNRRIALVVLPEQFVPSDVEPSPAQPGSTNPPPAAATLTHAAPATGAVTNAAPAAPATNPPAIDSQDARSASDAVTREDEAVDDP